MHAKFLVHTHTDLTSANFQSINQASNLSPLILYACTHTHTFLQYGGCSVHPFHFLAQQVSVVLLQKDLGPAQSVPLAASFQ